MVSPSDDQAMSQNVIGLGLCPRTLVGLLPWCLAGMAQLVDWYGARCPEDLTPFSPILSFHAILILIYYHGCHYIDTMHYDILWYTLHDDILRYIMHYDIMICSIMILCIMIWCIMTLWSDTMILCIDILCLVAVYCIFNLLPYTMPFQWIFFVCLYWFFLQCRPLEARCLW